jgi:hypothetical protein
MASTMTVMVKSTMAPLVLAENASTQVASPSVKSSAKMASVQVVLSVILIQASVTSAPVTAKSARLVKSAMTRQGRPSVKTLVLV